MLNKSNNIIEKEFKNLRKELLDLTLRNQLLNFKSRAKTITIVNQSPINLFQTLVLQENKMYFVANKKDKKEDKSSVWDHIPFDFSKFSEGDKKLATELTPKELQKRLYYINNQAKTMLQEQGYNILYLAIGFLEWKDKSKPRQKNNAPLVLIPVSMERKKVGESFNLEWTGEDIQTNISLKAKLSEAGIELPDFEFKKYGEVIDHYIASVQRAVSRMDGWKVNNNVALGFFSFTKFVMYNDLNPEAWEDNVDLTQNELIQAIFNPAKNDQEAFREEDIDSRLEYQNMYQVLDADSSQIAAIQDVKAGRNLVVEGPPGTGKSQTIVNLIAELLAEGKSVLFVSEKMAALDVVKDRLTGVGLGKFVLELHSHKTRRKKFLKDLQKATNVRAQEPLNIDQTIRKLETLRRQLDDYSQIIHKPMFAVNLSAFELYGLKESADDHFAKKGTMMPLVRFQNPESITLKELDDMKIALENLAELYQTISNENPWSNCAPKSLLPADLREIEMLINDTLFALDNFLVERGRVYDIYGIKQPDTLNEFNNSLSAFEIIKSQNAELIDGSIIKSGAWDGNNDDAFRLIQELQKYQKYAPFLNKFNQSIFNVNIDSLIHELQHLSTKKFRFFNNNQHMELVERYYADSIPNNIEDIIDDLKQAKVLIQIKNDLEAKNDLGQKYYGAYWHLNANPNDLKAIAKWMHEFTALIREGTFSQNTIDLLSKDLYDINPERDLTDYIDTGEEFVKVLSKLKDKLNPRSKLIFKRETGDVPFEAWKEQLYNWRGQLSSLHLWSQYLNTKNALDNSNAKMFVESIEKRNIKKEDIPALVEGNFSDSLLNILFVENHELATFVGELHENRIAEFKDLDKKILTLNRKRIFHKLNSNIPKIFGGTEDPQAKILAGEFTRKSGHMPVRKLLEKAGGMIKQIQPCFMMSPLSIAQYLDPTNEELQFDVVIFDEASQVKPEDALGAFMRGKTAVVMGDTQQLPPTSFFDQMSDADSDEEEATSLDMESILHLCKLSFPVKMLKWHYRSRHESLISVSNREFYDDDLLVYPSPSHNDPELGLKFQYNPNTAYARGSSSANPLEAEDVVEEIFNHFEKYGDSKSLGVGTFSVAQKNAILEALEVKRKEHPEFEALFSENKDERFFVKNLETIQGDERDVILISVGYGYDENHKMSLNFGPLNQDGGERRLNVLITRAREKCVVFSNFKAYDMKLTANPPYGVKALREFLEYAENLTLGTHLDEQHSKEPFEDAIASFLEENGYEVARQIGCAGFRVDLAIVDDENPGKYILGITTDGKMYSSSKVARDRDRLREQVLTGLGWKLYHLWSTDWYRNRDLGRKKLLEFVDKSIKQTRQEEKRKSEEAKKLAEKRRLEAEKKAEELRLAREKELAEKEQAEKEKADEIDSKDIGPSDFVEVEKVDDGDVLEKPVDVSDMDPSELFDDETKSKNDDGGDESSDVGKTGNDGVSVESSDVGKSDVADVADESSDINESDNDENIDDSTNPADVTFGESVKSDDYPLSNESEDDEDKESLNDNISSPQINEDDKTDSSKTSNEEVSKLDDDVSSKDGVEIWEDTKDYSEDSRNNKNISFKDRVKSFLKHDDSDSPNKSILPGLKFNKDLGEDSNLDEFSEDIDDNITSSKKSSFGKNKKTNSDEIVDLGSDDDYIYVDHSNDETVTDDDNNDVEVMDIEKSVTENNNESNDDLGHGEDVSDVSEDEVSDLGHGEDVSDVGKGDDDLSHSDVSNKGDNVNLTHEDNSEDISDKDGGEYVDLGPDENYIYVDHSNDEVIDDLDENNHVDDINDENDEQTDEIKNNSHNKGNFVKSFISDVVKGETKLQPEEIKTVKAEEFDDEKLPEDISDLDDGNMVDVEIYDDELNILNDELPDLRNNDEVLQRPTLKKEFKDDELNIFTDNLPDLGDEKIHDDATKIADEVMDNFIEEVFKNKELVNEIQNQSDNNNQPYIQNNESDDEIITNVTNTPSQTDEEIIHIQENDDEIITNVTNTPSQTDEEIDEIHTQEIGDEINNDVDESVQDKEIYYKGANDVNNPLRKNNVYYKKEAKTSLKDSIKGFKNDIKYINKSLNEIENPTEIDYVSVVDRTEDYDPNDYLNSSDDDSDKIIAKEEELTFAEKEEQRIEKELMMESLEKEIKSDDDVIVTVHEQERREELKDKALEDIIQNANDEYKEIEKERFKKENQLKSFDSHKLPGKKKMDDNVQDYVFADDFGLNSVDDLYNQPITNVSQSVKSIVEVEGPIHVNEVTKRVKDSCHIKRAGSKLKKTVNEAIDDAETSGNIMRIGDFLYDVSDNDVVIRKRNKPNIDLISDEEIAKSIELVLIHKNNVSTNQIAKETSRNFGFKSTSKKTASRINNVLDLMIADKKIKIINNYVELE